MDIYSKTPLRPVNTILIQLFVYSVAAPAMIPGPRAGDGGGVSGARATWLAPFISMLSRLRVMNRRPERSLECARKKYNGINPLFFNLKSTFPAKSVHLSFRVPFGRRVYNSRFYFIFSFIPDIPRFFLISR